MSLLDTTTQHACRYFGGPIPPPGTLCVAYCGVIFRLRGGVVPNPLPAEICPLCRLEAERQGTA